MKICLCGSTRFMDQFQKANVALTLAGHTVYTVAAVSTGNHSELTHDQKLALDAVHLAKIEESDAIMVVGVQEDGSVYIGDSTRREMMYASIRDKPIYFYDLEKAVEGEVRDFQTALKAASMTNEDREKQRQEIAARQQAFMSQFRNDEDEGVDETAEISEEKASN